MSKWTEVNGDYFYAQFLPLFQIWIVVIGLCSIIALFLSAKNRKEGALISLIGFFLFFVCAANDILVANKVLNPPYILSYGLVLFIFAQSYMLSLKFASTYRQVKKQGAELERKNVQLKQQEEARTLFFHNTSHELRTPLNGIIGFSELLLLNRFGDIGAEASDKVGKIKNLAQSLTYQVNTILDLAKSKKGELELNNSMFALDDLVRETQILSEGLSIKKPNIKANILNPGPTRTNMRPIAYPGENPELIKPPEEVTEYFLKLAETTCDLNGEIVQFNELKK